VKETLYPTLEEALYLHTVLIEKFGGTPGILDKGILDKGLLDKGLLESTLARPRSGYYPSLSEQAAALMQSLAMNHPFADGNKRVAFALTAVFLRINGSKLTVPPQSGVRFIEKDLIERHASLEAIRRWIEEHIK
jgi:death-on-curing protein